jgi:hypothetical protein
MLDMMTLSRAAAATLIAGVVMGNDAQGEQQLYGVWIEQGGYTENLVGGLLSGEDVHALQKSWAANASESASATLGFALCRCCA